MGGGLLQLVAYGAQDVYLTGNPQITFFKVVYRRHTNFAIEAIQQTFNGTPNFGNRVTCQISRNGDLIHRVYLAVVNYSSGINVCPYFGLRLINYVEIEIGGQKIDKHYSHWMYVWNELSLPVSKKDAYKKMVGANDKLEPLTNANLYIPLEFWFCRNVGLALPLIALQYHEVKINILFETKDNCLGNTGELHDLTSTTLWVDYIFLDTDERRRFAQLSHEYLIEQLQFTGTETLVAGTNRIKLNFNHPCKELIWVAKPVRTTNNTRWYDYNYADEADYSTASSLAVGGTSEFGGQYTSNYLVISDVNPPVYKNPFKNAILQLNGNDRFAVREGEYFNHVQPFQHHTNAPIFNSINVYSFALKPEDHQPSGTLNMSRIDTATLMVTTVPEANSLKYEGINIYAVNYNVLRILSGMGGLAYSN